MAPSRHRCRPRHSGSNPQTLIVWHIMCCNGEKICKVILRALNINMSALLLYEKGMGDIQANKGKTREKTTKGSHSMPKCSESTNPTCKVVRSKTKLIQLGNRTYGAGCLDTATYAQWPIWQAKFF